jgi:hypothetical protein
MMADQTDDDALGLDHPFDCPDIVSQRALAFCNLAKVADAVEDQAVRDECLTMMRKLTASIKSPPTAELRVISEARSKELSKGEA